MEAAAAAVYSQARAASGGSAGRARRQAGDLAAERRMTSRMGTKATVVTRKRQKIVTSDRAAVEAILPAGHVPPQITMASDRSGYREVTGS